MIQKHCFECGTALIEKELEEEGIVPYCPKCQQYRFPMYNVAVSMIVASIPKEERPAILEELKKKKSDRDDTVLERLKPSKPPPKPKPAPQKKKPTATENNTAPQVEQPETPVQEPITESPPEEEIEPTSNAPPSFLQSIRAVQTVWL